MARGAGAHLGSTYRLQLNGLGFGRARELVGYLHALGIEVLYVSPVLTAAPGSTHGYDVADATRIDDALGGAEGLEALLDELAAHDMRLLVDIVPNHVAASSANPWWWDVLRLGPASTYAGYFDIDWEAHGGRVLLPVLGKPLGEAVAAGEISVVDEDGDRVVAYWEQRFPLAPGSYGGRRGRRRPAGPADPEEIADLLARQHYRLAYWRLAAQEGNYRRFLDVDGLVGVRVEDPEVYEATHRLILELAADERVAGLRIDHVDGLADPAAYLRRLRDDLDRVRSEPASLLIEKIVDREERLAPSWPVEGMTGYEFADLAGGLLVAGDGAAALRGEHPFGSLVPEAKAEVIATLFPGQLERLAGLAISALDAEVAEPDLATAAMRQAFAALTVHLPVYRTYLDGGPVSASDRRLLARAVTAAASSGSLDSEGRRALDLLHEGLLSTATAAGETMSGWLEAARRWQQLTGAVAAKGVEDTALYRFDGLLAGAEVGGKPADPAVSPDEFHRAMADRARRHPGSLNTTSTHDTKRSEDVRARLAVLSEIPERWTAQVDRWRRRHRSAVDRPTERPSAHDEVLVYQSIAGTWPPGGTVGDDYPGRLGDYAVKAAREAKRETSWLEPDEAYERTLRAFVGRLLGPGGEPFRRDISRLVSSIGPAAATNSLALAVLRMTAPGVPDTYRGTEMWTFDLVDPDNRRPVDFAERVAAVARLAEGAESADGRRALAGRLLRQWPDGVVKLHVTRELLRLRRDRPALFERSDYLPLEVRGPRRGHGVAYARARGRERAIAVVPRLGFGLAGPRRFPIGASLWRGTSIVLERGASPRWADVLTGAVITAQRGRLPLGETLGILPVAVLVPA